MDSEDDRESHSLANEYTTGVRCITLNLPEDEGEGLGFRLTRTLWDPYPWVREVTVDSRADAAGLKMGDCILQADGKDLLGLPVGQVAGLIRGDGGGRGVSLLVWNCGVDPKDDPELLWSCGGGSRGEKARRALSGAVKALACSVCASTATHPLCCRRSHLYCHACWSRLERCALCREQLPPKDSPYARNLVAEQVFEAIATEYEIKNVKKRPTETISAYTSPNRSPNMSPHMSPSVHRRGQYQLSLMSRTKHVQFGNSASDPNIHRSFDREIKRINQPGISGFSTKMVEKNATKNPKVTQACQNNLPCNSNLATTKLVENANNFQANTQNTNLLKPNENVNRTKSEENFSAGNSTCSCQIQLSQNNPTQKVVPHINCLIPHRVVATLRQACSMADLQNAQNFQVASLDLGTCKGHGHHSSLENLKTQCGTVCDPPVFLLSAPPIYVVTCDHNKNESK